MRILFFQNVADVYGGSRSLQRLAAGLRQAGHTVGVVLPEEGPLRSALETAGVEVILLPSLPVLHRHQLRGPFAIARLARRYRAARAEIDKLLQAWSPDIVHTNNTGILPVAGACARRCGIPHVLHVRESFTGFGFLWKPYRLWLLRTADVVVCISDFVARGFTVRQRQIRVRVLRNGLPRGEFDGIGDAQTTSFRRQFGLEGPLVGLVGRIKLRRKGQEVFIEAAARLQARHPAVSFLIVGSPFPGNESHLAALQALVKARGLEGRVKFIGHLEDTRPALAALDVSVMASVDPEPLGNVTIESMALGKPVVGTNVGGTAEILHDGVTGLLVPPGDAEAMATAIDRLLRDPAERERIGRAAKATFLRELEFSGFCDGICHIYRSLASRAGKERSSDGKSDRLADATNTPSPADSIIPQLLTLAILGLGFVLFHFWGITYSGLDVRDTTRSAFVWLIRRWRDSSLCFGSDYSHGWLVVPVSAWLIWRRRAELRAAPRRPTPAGLSLVTAGLLAHWLGARAEIPHLSVLGMLSLLWSIPFYLRGWPTARILLFPWAYLLLSVPWNFFESVTFPLRMLMAATSSFLLNGMGIPAMRSGTAIYSSAGEGFNFDVADPCSGIRSLVAMIALVTAYAYVTQRSWLKRGLLFAASIPLAIAGNISRILVIALAAVAFGTRTAMGFYHDYSGYIVFASAILMLTALQAALNRWLPDKESERPPATVPPAALGHDGPARWQPRAIILALMAATLVALAFSPHLAVSPQTSIRMELPPRVGDWTGVEVLFCHQPQCLKEFQMDKLATPDFCPACGGKLFSRSLGESQLLPPDTVILRRRYTRPGHDAISVTLVGSGRERASLHRPEICLTGQGGRIKQSRVIPISLPHRAPLNVMALDLVRTLPLPGGGNLNQKSLYIYWFVGQNRETPSHFQRIIWMGYDRVFRNVARQWVFLTIATAEPRETDDALRRVTDFLQAFYPLLKPDDSAAQDAQTQIRGL